MSKRVTSPDTYLVPPPKPGPLVCETLVAEDHTGAKQEVFIVNEKPLTVYLNAREGVTAMTIGDHPVWLARGFLANQAMLQPDNPVTDVDYDAELGVVVVRTQKPPDFEAKMAKRIRTSGCAQGTVFADVMDHFDSRSLAEIETSVSTA